jgi:AcrR family transcriptional regulator
MDNRKTKTHKRIVTYADKVFSQRGFRKVTVEELCAGMAISKRTFYKYFKNRDDLVEEIFRMKVSRIAPKILANLSSDKPIGEILETHFALMRDELFSKLSEHMMVDIQTLMPELWEQVEEIRSKVVGIMIDLLKRGQTEGSVRSDIDPEVIGKIIQGLMMTVANPSFMMEQGLSMSQVGNTLSAFMLHGILGPDNNGSENLR